MSNQEEIPTRCGAIHPLYPDVKCECSGSCCVEHKGVISRGNPPERVLICWPVERIEDKMFRNPNSVRACNCPSVRMTDGDIRHMPGCPLYSPR